MAYKIGQVVINNTEECWKISNDEYAMKGSPIDAFTQIQNNYGVYNLNNIGIQSRPGAIFAIDDEIIIIGRSGVYELSNSLVSISSIKLLSIDTFIIDFRY